MFLAGFVLVPANVAMQRLSGTFDVIWSFPVPRSAGVAASFYASPEYLTGVGGGTVVSWVTDLYRVLLGPPLNRTELLAVNVDPRESDLRLLNERELQGTLLSGIDARLLRSDLPVEAAAAESAAPSTLSRWLLMMALILLLVEQVMAWNARLGLVSLLASPLVLLLFALSPVAAVVVLAAGALVLIGLRWWKLAAA